MYFFHQLFDEFKVLQQENEDVRSVNSELQYQLEEAHKKTITYKTSIDKYQVLESQYKRYIRTLCMYMYTIVTIDHSFSTFNLNFTISEIELLNYIRYNLHVRVYIHV